MTGSSSAAIRVAAIGFVAAALATGCSGGAGGQVAFAQHGGDAWLWTKTVRGSATGCDRVSVSGNGRQVVATAPIQAGSFSAVVPLGEGRNRLAAVCHRGDDTTTSLPLVIRERLVRRPVVRIRVSLDGRDVVLDGAASEPGPPTHSPIVSYRWSARAGDPASFRLPASAGPRIRVPAPRTDGEYYVTLRVTDASGRSDESTAYFVVRRGRPQLVDLMRDHAAWIDHAVVYGVIPRNFGEHGFRSVTARLPYLKSLGINTIWLAPIFATPEGDFGYAVTDYFHLNPAYGTKAEFRVLVRRAHQLGIRVLMDFIPNHTSDQHPYFKNAARYGTESNYWNYYDRDAAGEYTWYFDWTNLPNLNYSNPEVRSFILSAFEYWVRNFHVDGFRVDAAWGVKKRRPTFWPAWRRALLRLKPDLLLLAEASATDPYYFSHGFDAAYDWTRQIGHWAWAGAFDKPNRVVQRLRPALTNRGRGYAKDALIFRFLNNNDTGPRFIVFNERRLTLTAAAFLLTLPGIPCIYTGDEVGANYLPYDEFTPISFADPLHMRGRYRFLIHLRERIPSLHSRDWLLLPPQPGTQVLDYLRYTGHDSDPVLAVFNFGLKPAEARVRLPPRFAGLTASGALRDLISGKTFAADGTSVSLPMGPESARILVNG